MSFDLVTGGMSYAVFLLSTTCHEASHAWTALRLGDDTAARGGQVTLDPTPHVRREPIGMVVVPIFSFLLGGGMMLGWASAPYDPEWARRWPRRAALMALAGPGANLSIALLAAVVIRTGELTGYFEHPARIGWSQLTLATGGGFGPFFAGMASLFFSMNLLLGIFNLLPIPPLDGAAMPLLFLSERAAESWQAAKGSFGFFGLFLAWKLFDVVFPPVWRAATALLLGPGLFH